jgi:hypothetical protein
LSEQQHGLRLSMVGVIIMGQWCGNLLLHAEGMPICESLMIARQYKLKIGVQQLHRRASKSLLPFLASARIIRLLRKPFRDITSQLLYILTKIIGASFQHQAYYSCNGETLNSRPPRSVMWRYRGIATTVHILEALVQRRAQACCAFPVARIRRDRIH